MDSLPCVNDENYLDLSFLIIILSSTVFLYLAFGFSPNASAE